MSAVILSTAALPTPYRTLCAYSVDPDDETLAMRPCSASSSIGVAMTAAT